MIQKLEEAREAVRALCPNFPKYLVVLGSGLGSLLDELKVEVEIPFDKIPHLRNATVQGHKGKILVGQLSKTRVACMQGRLHYYEGYSMEEVVFPFRVFALCGTEVFLLTNASGGLRSDMKPMDLLVIRDHINLMGNNPLIGKNEEKLGVRFPDMTHLYDPALRQKIKEIAKRVGIELKEGVYAAVHGPSYETPAEIKMYTLLGADVVGMSTVPEAIALGHMNKKVVAVSCITNLAAGVGKDPLVHSEVLENAKKAQTVFGKLVKEFFDGVSL